MAPAINRLRISVARQPDLPFNSDSSHTFSDAEFFAFDAMPASKPPDRAAVSAEESRFWADDCGTNKFLKYKDEHVVLDAVPQVLHELPLLLFNVFLHHSLHAAGVTGYYVVFCHINTRSFLVEF